MKASELKFIYTDIHSKIDQFFLGKNYTNVPDVLISSDIDATTLFVGSTISVMKDILSKKVDNKYYMTQRCLRNRNLKEYYINTHGLIWTSCFDAFGLLVPFNQLSLVIEDLCLFMSEQLNVEKSQLRLSIHENDNWLFGIIKKTKINYPVTLSSENLSRFRHQYGIDGISGVNINFEIKNKFQTFIPFANFNILIDERGNYIGAEFGMGLGSFIYGLYHLSSRLEATFANYMQGLVKDQMIADKVKDALSVMTHMCRENVWPGGKGQRDICKRYFKFIATILSKHNVDINYVIDNVKMYEFLEYDDNLLDTKKMKECLLYYE